MNELNLIFRQYQPNKDIQSLVKFLFTGTTTAKIKEEDKLFLNHPDTHYRFVVEDLENNSLVGTITLILDRKIQSRSATIFSVVTRQDKCREGIGSLMIEKIKKFSKSRNLDHLLVSTTGKNQAAKILFIRTGFIEVEKLPDGYISENRNHRILEDEIFFHFSLEKEQLE